MNIEAGRNIQGSTIIEKEMFQKQLLRRTKWQDSIIEQSFPSLALNHSLPSILNLLDIEKEVFYLIHFACYLDAYTCKNDIMSLSQKAMLSILGKKSRQETAAELKQRICQEVDCHFTVISKTWMNCFDNETIDDDDYQEWCKSCKGYDPPNPFMWEWVSLSFSLKNYKCTSLESYAFCLVLEAWV